MADRLKPHLMKAPPHILCEIEVPRNEKGQIRLNEVRELIDMMHNAQVTMDKRLPKLATCKSIRLVSEPFKKATVQMFFMGNQTQARQAGRLDPHLGPIGTWTKGYS